MKKKPIPAFPINALPENMEQEKLQQQLDLSESADSFSEEHSVPPPPDENRHEELSALNESATERAFFPSNREDLLYQLGSMVFSSAFPTEAKRTAVQENRLAILKDGLRAEEILLLQGEHPARFPVLVELKAGTPSRHGHAISISDIVALRFRSEDEADDFRFRPVDEFNTGTIPCSAEPRLFGLEGGVRFQLAADPSAETLRLASLLDRIGAGICSLVELGTLTSPCWQAIGDFLCDPEDPDGSAALTLRMMGRIADGVNYDDHNEQSLAILRTFSDQERRNARQLVDALHHGLTGYGAEGRITKTEDRWREKAVEVISNKITLDGELLSDEGSIPLRAAMLAATIDDTSSLVHFLQAEKPAGPKVATAAAFLIGLKTGIAGMPWNVKCKHTQLLSEMLAACHPVTNNRLRAMMESFIIEPEETPEKADLSLWWKERPLAKWNVNVQGSIAVSESDTAKITNIESASSTDDGQQTVSWLSELVTAGFQRNSVNEGDNLDFERLLAPDGKTIEVFQPKQSDEEMVTLRFSLVDSGKLRKQKELFEASLILGNLWRVGITADGQASLILDLLRAPTSLEMARIMEALDRALALYTVAKKATRNVSKSGTRKPRRKKADEPQES